MQMSELALILFAALLSGPQEMQYECVTPEGGTVVQRAPCKGMGRTATPLAPTTARRAPPAVVAEAERPAALRPAPALLAQDESRR